MMKIALNIHDDHQYSVLQRVLDGTLAISSIEEFNEILDIYPKDPLLHRKYADFLVEKGKKKDGSNAYDQAARLFIDHQMNLQAIVAKILQWSLQKPSHEKGRSFHALLHADGGRQTPLQRFWARMSYAELVTVMLRLVRVRIPAGETISRIGDAVNEIYFIVSGTLAETPDMDRNQASDARNETPEPFLIGANDIFGDIFPLDQLTTAATDIKAITDVEMVKIAKPVLREICKKHPRIESYLKDVHKPVKRDHRDRTWQTVRRAMRFGLPTKVEIVLPALNPGQQSWRHTGISMDLSMAGMCIDLGETPPLIKGETLKGRTVQLYLDLLNEVADLDISGKIIWHHEQSTEKGPVALIGIRFNPLNAVDRELLAEYCSGSVGEQNLLWSLWDTWVSKDNP